MNRNKFFLLLVTFFFSINCYPTSGNSLLPNKLQSLLDNFRMDSDVPAAVLSINYSDTKISNFVSGTVKKLTAANSSVHITTDSLFQIGSITKSFTAVIILQLEAEGKLSINDTIYDITKKYGQWLPKKEYAAWKDISIKQLLNMTSGIFSVTEDTNFMNMLAIYPKKSWSTKEILKYALIHKPYFDPGSGWHYSDTNYNILELLIEAVTHHSFKEEIDKRILKKYGLNNTYYLPYKYPEHITKRMAHGYVFEGGGFSPPMKSGSDMTFTDMSAAGAAGALVSTSEDITRWIRLVFTGKVLPSQQLNEMLSAVCIGNNNTCIAGEPLPADSHSDGFSLGLTRIYDPELGQIWVYLGETPGYYSGLMWLPEKKIALALTTSGTTSKSKKLLKTLAEVAKLIQDKSSE